MTHRDEREPAYWAEEHDEEDLDTLAPDGEDEDEEEELED